LLLLDVLFFVNICRLYVFEALKKVTVDKTLYNDIKCFFLGQNICGIRRSFQRRRWRDSRTTWSNHQSISTFSKDLWSNANKNIGTHTPKRKRPPAMGFSIQSCLCKIRRLPISCGKYQSN